MNTIHQTTNDEPMTTVAFADDNEPTHDEPPKKEPIWRVVGGSVAAGFIGALVLTLGVFGGATEPVIAGAALLAFAGGWAMLAWLSQRFTSQSQRWARVPAIGMAATGATLLIAQPGDRVLNDAGWVWPPVAIAVIVWMFVQMRRSLRGRVRWLLYPILVSLAIGSIGAMFQTTSRATDATRAPGKVIDVGGHRLHINCIGSGSPTVVLESGLGGTSPAWTRIMDEVGRTARICAYDRAGQMWSDDIDNPQDGHAIASDLHTLLAKAGEQGPFVLVGHSAGGPYIMNYAATYPTEVAGMVLLDSMNPDEFTALPGFAGEQAMMRRGLAVLPSLGRMGVGRILPTSIWSSQSEPVASQIQVFASSARGMRNMRDEQSMYPTVFEQAMALTSIGNKPLVVVTATESLQQHAEWSAEQDRLAALSTNSQRRTVDATHGGLVDDTVTYEPSVVAILDVVQSVRTGQPVIAR